MACSRPRRLQESQRKSILQVLQNSFSYYDRNTFIHRFIYVGEMSIETEGTIFNSSSVVECFQKCIKPINDRYCDEPITGFFLYFGNYFCHVLESSEESLVRHLRLLKENEQIKEHFETFKLIIVYHHMNQRFIEEWVPLKIDKPNDGQTISHGIIRGLPVMVTHSNQVTTLEETMRKSKSLIEKLYSIGNSLKEKVEESKGRITASSRRCARLKSPSSRHAKIDIDVNLLPDYDDLEFLVKSSYTKPVRVYLDVYNTIPYINEDNVFPTQNERIPKHMFETEVNPVPNLLTNNIK